MGFDSIFWRSPWTPVQIDFGQQVQQALGTPSVPLTLATTSGYPELWLNTGVVGEIIITDSLGNSQTFSDCGWGPQPLIQIRNLGAALVGADPTGGGENQQYFTPASETTTAILAKLALPCPQGGSIRRLCTAFSRVLSAR
jgi:hypothetical protein